MYYNRTKTPWFFLINIYLNLQIETSFLKTEFPYEPECGEKKRKIGLEIVLA